MNRFLLYFIFTLGVFAEPSQQELLKQIRQVQEIELSIQKEAVAWKSEKKKLELLLQVYQNRNNDSKESLKVLKSEKERLTSELKKISVQKTDLEGKINSLNGELNKLKESLLNNWHAKLPSPMKKLLPEEFEALSAAKNVNEKITSIEVYVSAYLELQKQKHLLTEARKIGDSEWQLNCLYLGTVQGFFMSQNGEKCGKIIRQNNRWEFVEDSALKPALIEAFAQMKQEGRPKLVELPLELSK